MAGRVGDLGRDRGGHGGRDLDPSSPRGRRRALPRRGGTGAAGRPGDRAGRQLLQPGALRRSHRPPVGGADRPGPPPGRTISPIRRSIRPSSTSSSSTSASRASWCGSAITGGSVRPGLFALYVTGYSGFRIFEELLRVDPAHHLFGLRLNFYVACALTLAGAAWFAAIQMSWRPRRPGRRAGQIGAVIAIGWAALAACGCAQDARAAQHPRGDRPPARVATDGRASTGPRPEVRRAMRSRARRPEQPARGGVTTRPASARG